LTLPLARATIAAMPNAIPTMVTLADAQRMVREHVRPLPPRSLALSDAVGRTLAEGVRCDVDVPPFDRAMMDGYAVRAADVARVPVDLRLIGQVAAGAADVPTVSSGEAAQINTGAPLPAHADAVAPFEDTALSADRQIVTVNCSVAPDRHICRRGTYVRAGDDVLHANDRIGPGEVAIAATAGATRVKVFSAPCVGLLVTGDELIGVERKPAGGQIRDSNGPMLSTLLAIEGTEVTDLGRAGDDRTRLAELIDRGLDSDALCITGGISMGAFDFVPDALIASGVRIHFQKMRTKPGKPTLFGTTDGGTLVFALPGNPISALIGYWMLVRPALAGMQGRDAWPRTHRAILCGSRDAGGTSNVQRQAARIKATGDRESFHPARVELDESSRLFATPLTWYGSGDPFGLRGANGFIVRAAQSPEAQEGDAVDVILMHWNDTG
jgi:molybdenum cofactor synthesis domain-containing protein